MPAKNSGGDFVMTLTKSPWTSGEILQSYGEKTNTMLLIDYGFVLPKAAIPASTSLSIKLPQIQEDEQMSKKKFWLSCGGRLGKGEMTMEVNIQTFPHYLRLQRAAVLCESTINLENVDEKVLKLEKLDPNMEEMVKERCHHAIQHTLKRLQRLESINTSESSEVSEVAMAAERCCVQVIREELDLLEELLSHLSEREAGQLGEAGYV